MKKKVGRIVKKKMKKGKMVSKSVRLSRTDSATKIASMWKARIKICINRKYSVRVAQLRRDAQFALKE